MGWANVDCVVGRGGGLLVVGGLVGRVGGLVGRLVRLAGLLVVGRLVTGRRGLGCLVTGGFHAGGLLVVGTATGFVFIGLLLHLTLSGQSQKLLTEFHLRGGAQVNLNDSPLAHIK